MTRIEPEREKERLAALYAAMSDGELREIGGNPAKLTEWAEEVLAAEMKKRGLEWSSDPKEKKRTASSETTVLVALGSYQDQIQAEAVARALRPAGIEYFHVQEAEKGRAQITAGKEIFVRREDLAIAQSLIEATNAAEATELAGGDEDFAGSKPVILRRYRDMPAAYADKSALESAGIQCYLWNANLVRMDWLWSNALDGIKLVVRESEAEDAARILDTKVGEDFGEA
jgi:hypothetical protein